MKTEERTMNKVMTYDRPATAEEAKRFSDYFRSMPHIDIIDIEPKDFVVKHTEVRKPARSKILAYIGYYLRGGKNA